MIITTCLKAQPWEQNNAIFNPSGVPSLPFSQPRFADLDGDGDQDMVIGTTDDRPFYMKNTGTATVPSFTPEPGIFVNVSSLDAEMGVFYDIDNDGDLDFITGGFTGLNLYINTGTITAPQFEKVNGFFDGLDVGMSPVPDLADLDNDGDPDMVVGLSESGVLKIYTNTGSPLAAQFSESNMVVLGDIGLYAYPVFRDLDADGDQDILAGRDDHGFIYYQNNGNPTSPVWETNNAIFAGIGTQTYWNSPDLVDLNGDSKPDLVFGSAAGPLNYYINTGTPSAPIWTLNTTLFGGVLDVGGASNPYFFDYDGDGDLDMFSGSQLGNIKYFENTGTASGPAWEENSAPFATLKHSIYSAVAVGDVNGDGLPDAIVGDLSGKLYYHRNSAVGFVLDANALASIALGGWSAPRLVDLDQDGDLDIVAGNEAGKLNFIRNNGTPTSPSWTLIPNYFGSIDVGTNCVPSIADLDLDGDLDIITGNLSGDVQYFENTGTGWVENSAPVQGLTGGQNDTPALADLDGDGDDDLTLGNYDGTFDYYKNNAIIAGAGEIPGTPAAIALTASPNPFTGSVALKFRLSSTADVSMQVVNICGQQIYSEKWQNMVQGNQCMTWNATALSPGIYFIRVIAGDMIQTIKVIKQ